MIARRDHRNLAVLIVGDQNHALDPHLLGLDKRHHRVEVPLGRLVDLLVASDKHIGRYLSHHDSPFRSGADDLIDAQVFCMRAPRPGGGLQAVSKWAINLIAVMLGRNT